MKSIALALRVAGVAEMTMLFRYAPCHPAGEHPANAPCRRGLFSLPSARKATPAAEKPPRFLQHAFAGCNTLHLAGKVVCQTFPLDSLSAGLAPCSPSPTAAGKGGAGDSAVPSGRVSHYHRHHCHHRHRPKNTRRKRKELNAYALRNPAFPETQGRLCGCL